MTIATGGTIVEVGIWKYHYFYSSGTLVVTEAGDLDWLVVAGGGGAGGGYGFRGGCGGAGGYLSGDDEPVVVTSYTVTVGAAGAKAPHGYARGSKGGDSELVTISALAKGGGEGGRGSTTTDDDGGSGGSGGGGGRAGGTPGNGGAGTAGQGYAGAKGVGNGAPWVGVGGSASGAGVQYSYTSPPGLVWHDGVEYAKGGESNTGGADGGDNTGDGGGGGAYTPVGSGGSGIVVVRYLQDAKLHANLTLDGTMTVGRVDVQSRRVRPRRSLVWMAGVDGVRRGVIS